MLVVCILLSLIFTIDKSLFHLSELDDGLQDSTAFFGLS